MRYLIVEDDEANQRALVGLIASRDLKNEITICGNRSEAEGALKSQDYYDLIILDLRIPESGSTSATPDVSQGLALLEIIRRRAPAVVVRVLTAYPDMDLASGYQNRFDVQSIQAIPALSFTSKRKMLKVGEYVDELLAFRSAASAIEIYAPGVTISDSERMLFAQIGMLLPVVRENITQFSSGLSGARSFKVDLYNIDGAPIGNLFAKIDSLERISGEVQNYQRFVAPQLNVGSLPALAIDRVVFYDRAMLCYRLAHEYPYNLFEFCLRGYDAQRQVIERLERIDDAWLGNVVAEELCAQDLLRKLWMKFEDVAYLLTDAERDLIQRALAVNVRFRRATQHSDLHGDNILVAEDGEPLLIDFGSVNRLPAPADAVFLELSFALHPQSLMRSHDWPSIAAARDWVDVDKFVKDSPYAEAIRSCRNWAHRVVEQISTRAIYSIALAYAVRHFRFASSRNEVAVGIALSCATALLREP